MPQKRNKNNGKKSHKKNQKSYDVMDIFIQNPAQKISALSPSLSPKEQIFELLISYCDILNETRDQSLASLDIASFQKHPCLLKECADMLLSKLTFKKTIPFLTDIGFTILLIDILKTWRDDDSRDLSKTMAKLDKRLTQIDGIMLKLKVAA